MKKYKVDWCEVKKEGETNGRKWKITEMVLIDDKDIKTEKVSTFDDVMAGQEIEGEITTNDKGYLNFKSAPSPKAVAGANFKSAQIKEVMDIKEKSIARFQDKKEESIALMSAQRDAVLIVNTLLTQFPHIPDVVEIKTMIVEWRNWFLSEEFRTPPPF